MATPKEIEKKLISIIAQSLQIPEEDVTLNSLLINELEAESIDILDIRFAIEQQFGIKFNNDEIKALMEKLMVENKVTHKDIPALFTVRNLFDYINFALHGKYA